MTTSPDFPELTTFGDDREEVVARAVQGLEEAIAPNSQGWRTAVILAILVRVCTAYDSDSNGRVHS